MALGFVGYVNSQIEAHPYLYRGLRLESDSQASPKARHRFGFSGKRKRPLPSVSTPVSSDDILDSLTRQAASQVGFREEQTQGLELLAETEEPTLYSEPIVSTETQIPEENVRRLGHYAFVIMCVVGMVVVWLYSSGRGMLDASLLTGLIPKTGVQSVFTDPLQIGIVSIIAMITGLWVALRRRASRLQFPL